tara:strand:+ start:235 stop:642 length:408 start_codon:yes stop_codon:yes gene_type:complete
MIEEKFLEVLPENFRHEKYFLIKNKLNDFKKLSQLSDSELNNIQKLYALCSLNNLKKIRAIANFKSNLSITPYESYLLLHCGIGSIKSLSNLNPYDLKERIGRLERSLRTKTQTNITLSTLKDWIKKANQICKSI